MRAFGPFLAAALVAGLLAGCAGTSAERHDVMASFYPVAFLARAIGEPNVSVGVVVEPGIEPHDYEPTPGDLAALSSARLVLLQGSNLEGWIETARGQASGARFVTLADGLPLRDNPDEDEAADMPKDPHTWLDPTLHAQASRLVEEALAETFPQHAAAFRQRGEDLRARLAQLDAEFQAGLADCDVRFVVTNHAAFGYMAARYGFTMIPISGLDPEAEPTPATLRDVVEQVKAHNVTVVFFEDLVSPRVAEAVAREAGATTRVLSPIEGILPEDEAKGADYFSRMRDDLAALRDGMRCR